MNVKDCEWQFLSKLRTLAEPHEPLPRLSEFLEWLTLPDLDHVWVLLDIKVSGRRVTAKFAR